jgi:hypothetical protein
MSTEIGLFPGISDRDISIAERWASSGMVPKAYDRNPGAIMVAVQMGAGLGMQPMAALQGIAVINGKPSLYGDAMMALVRSSGVCEYVKEWEAEGIAYCQTHRKGEQEPETRTFSMDQAKAAGYLTRQGPWKQTPARMLQMRARAFCLRDVYADKLQGMAMVEEVRDITPEPERDVTPVKTKLAGAAGVKAKMLNQEPLVTDTPEMADAVSEALDGELVDPGESESFSRLTTAVLGATNEGELKAVAVDIATEAGNMTDMETATLRKSYAAQRDTLNDKQVDALVDNL